MSTLAGADVSVRYDAMMRISAQLARHRSIGELVRVLAEKLHAVVPFEYLGLILHDSATDRLKLLVLEPADMPRPPFDTVPTTWDGPAAQVWRSQQASVIPIPDAGPLPPGLEYTRGLGHKVTCWLPLTTANARVGVLAFGSSCASDYPDEAVVFMEHVAAHVAVAVDNAINFDRARQLTGELTVERDRLRLLLDVGNLLVSHLDYGSLLKEISDSIKPVISHEHVSVSVHEESTDTLRVPLTCDEGFGVSARDIAWPVDRSPAGAVFQRRATAVFERGEIDAFPPEGTAGLPRTPRLKLCCLPLVTRHGVVGTLNVASAAPDAFSANDVDLLEQIAIQIGIAVANARAYRAIEARTERLEEQKQYFEDEIRHEFAEIIGRSASLKRVLQMVKTVAPTDATVLLLGETGTGKELIARAIHRLSARSQRSFVRFSAAALPTSLLESELFGFGKGAFTGATIGKVGR